VVFFQILDFAGAVGTRDPQPARPAASHLVAKIVWTCLMLQIRLDVAKRTSRDATNYRGVSNCSAKTSSRHSHMKTFAIVLHRRHLTCLWPRILA
jgi:hypothetical protein